jgi:AhpD family alkylhydroperoxidase
MNIRFSIPAVTPVLFLAALVCQGADAPAITYSVTPLKDLQQQARSRESARPRVALLDSADPVFKGIETLEPASSDRIPNYLRALGSAPHTAQPFAHLVKTALYSGALEPEVKLAMALRISQLLDSPYVAAHTRRLLASTERGQGLLTILESGNFDSLAPSDHLAVNYAEWLTQDVHGVSNDDFRRVRGHFNDGQVVELTTTVCFFNYFTRFTEALRLPVEPWILQSKAEPAHGTYSAPIARVTLISDAEAKALAEFQERAAKNSNGWGIGLANSMRSMLLAPEMASAWFGLGNSVREYDAVSREIKLQVSFAVSTANGCRYCTLHQVLGLRKLGVSPAKLMQMKKDDSALTLEERTAVLFARKLTRQPSSIEDADYQKLSDHFGVQGALEVLFQTCTFAYMNHYTDGLRLPSEDEAIRTYRETYGTDWTR